MPKWLVPITIVEYGRCAVVVAPSRREAIAAVRRNEWEELTDADHYAVTTAGAVRPLPASVRFTLDD